MELRRRSLDIYRVVCSRGNERNYRSPAARPIVSFVLYGGEAEISRLSCAMIQRLGALCRETAEGRKLTFSADCLFQECWSRRYCRRCACNLADLG